MSGDPVAEGYAELVAIGYRAAIADAARACADRAELHALAAERLLPGTAAIEFMALRGEAAACERAVRALGQERDDEAAL